MDKEWRVVPVNLTRLCFCHPFRIPGCIDKLGGLEHFWFNYEKSQSTTTPWYGMQMKILCSLVMKCLGVRKIKRDLLLQYTKLEQLLPGVEMMSWLYLQKIVTMITFVDLSSCWPTNSKSENLRKESRRTNEKMSLFEN